MKVAQSLYEGRHGGQRPSPASSPTCGPTPSRFRRKLFRRCAGTSPRTTARNTFRRRPSRTGAAPRTRRRRTRPSARRLSRAPPNRSRPTSPTSSESCTR
jgi:hypothetical protein